MLPGRKYTTHKFEHEKKHETQEIGQIEVDSHKTAILKTGKHRNIL